jgi:hypothetical protein
MAYKTAKSRSGEPITPSCKKKIYNSLEEAQDMIRYIKENRIVKELNAYKCPICGMWHLTSQSK